MKIPVSERALFARIDRKLAKEGERLRRCREGSAAHTDFGSYYVIDVNLNTVTAKHCDLESLGKELGVLAEWEQYEG